ncbi:hypothetical protein [Flavobacterium sp.]|uniref:hypothetical protein n=1 Tax=Flavobacterium sp. TaxID=239 RepID=UPI002D070E5C|nr:hypothetical protein [Flavobacterium sp.]HSD05938.1 hypothetical protein [Flavobacterium sp.]
MKNATKILIILFGLTACVGGKNVSTSAASSVNTINSQHTESTQKLIDYKSYSVARIDNCGQSTAADSKTFSLFPGSNNGVKNQSFSDLNFSNWNHTTNGNATEWSNLKMDGSNYNFSDSVKVDSSCNNAQTFHMILLKKIANWDHQHSNGFECNILAQGYKFGDIENIVFDLKINSAKTNIPSISSIKTTYAKYVSNAVVDALDEGKINIGITLGDNTNLNASIIIQLDQEDLSDKWIRVTIPMNKLAFYQEINYKKTPKTQEDLRNVVINRMLIVGETKSGSTLRGNINSWNNNIPETFKEMDLSFKKIELQLK